MRPNLEKLPLNVIPGKVIDTFAFQYNYFQMFA